MEKKTIKINYCGFWDDFDPRFNCIDSVLKERYHIEISDHPDFVFCSPLGDPYDYMKYDCVRILYSGEPFSPDFNIFDYAMSYDHIDFGDRYLRYPLSLWRNVGECAFRPALTEEQAYEKLAQKKFFCNFIQGHPSESGRREALFRALQDYKRVESAGSFMNNQPDGHTVRGETKFRLIADCKFSICAESLEYPGFTSEKLTHGFAYCSIPIYIGDPLVGRVFNPRAFVNCADYRFDLTAIVDRVREIDETDDLYIEMLCQPITNDPDYCHTQFENLKSFLYHIFDQSPADAFRRVRYYCAGRYERYAKEYAEWVKSPEYRVRQKIKSIRK